MKYPDPESYRPERWLEAGWPTFQEPSTQYPTLKGMTSFGFGQRQCLGMSLTQDELVVACGSLAWCFNLKRKIDPVTGQEIEVPTDECGSLLIIKPDPFQMAFEPRSEKKAGSIMRQWQESDARDKHARETFVRTSAMGKTDE